MYDEIADALVRAGARHVELDGAGHRVQDHAEATGLIREVVGAQG
ncbi:hypothetical protein [Cellulomonas sp. HZM]|nr:hypothetical protein [Cellulomonas sp. HZM]